MGAAEGSKQQQEWNSVWSEYQESGLMLLSASTSSAHRRLAARAWTDSASTYLTLSAVLDAASKANEVRSLMVPRPSQRPTCPGPAQVLPKSCPVCRGAV